MNPTIAKCVIAVCLVVMVVALAAAVYVWPQAGEVKGVAVAIVAMVGAILGVAAHK